MAGGAICKCYYEMSHICLIQFHLIGMELLTRQGWASAYTMEAVIMQLTCSFVKGQATIKRTKPPSRKKFSKKLAEASFRYFMVLILMIYCHLKKSFICSINYFYCFKLKKNFK